MSEQARQRWKTVGLISGWTVAALFAVAAHLRYVEGITGAIFSDSEPQGLYRETSGPIERDGMVQLRALMKHVAGIPGDTVRVTPEGSYINGILWDYSAIPSDVHSRPYPFGTYTLPPRQYWLLGRNPSSWDSRYLGPFPDDMINSPIKPFWTASNGYAAGTSPWGSIWDAATGNTPGTPSWVDQQSQKYWQGRHLDPNFKPPPLPH